MPDKQSSLFEIDFDFRKSLRETIVLLGGRVDIANLLNKSIDSALTEPDLIQLQQYNIDLFRLAKDKLANLSTIKIKVKPNE